MLVTSRSTPLGNLDQVIRLSEGIFSDNLTKLAQESPNPRRLSCALILELGDTFVGDLRVGEVQFSEFG